MARWNKTPEDFNQAIIKSKERIAKLQAQLEQEELNLLQLETGKRDAEMQIIYDYMKDHDLSPTDIINQLTES